MGVMGANITALPRLCSFLESLGESLSPFRGLINNRSLFLTVLEAGKSKSKELAGSVSGEDPLPGSWTAVFSLCPHMEERMRGLSGSLSLGHRAHS